jgi:hypothetical protein
MGAVLLLLSMLPIRAADTIPAPPAPGPRTLPPALAQRLAARTNTQPPGFQRPPVGARTNSMPAMARSAGAVTNAGVKRLPPGKTNVLAAPQHLGVKTNALPVAHAGGTNATGGIFERVRHLPQNRGFYPAIAGVALCVGVVLLWRVLKSEGEQKPAPGVVPSKALVLPAMRKAGKVTFHSCNVLEAGTEARRVWQFDARGAGFVLGRQQTSLAGEALPGVVAKDWRSLFQHKLNIAWLPSEHLFLRVTQVPRSDFAETLSMVELQLEKLSPMPVAQIAWSFQVLPHATGNLQTVIVLMVARSIVEEFLGQLEGQGYLADRLELPVLDQLQATPITEDGAWVYPGAAGGKNSALVAWWYGGMLQNLDFLTMPPADRPAVVREQLLQMAWAGELEGWLTAPPEWHLVADVAAAEWEPALREALEQPVEVLTPLAPAELAASTARRAAYADPRANLLPAEFTTRYHQQFIDRLWMRALLAVGGLYLAGVAIYIVALTFANYRTNGVEQEVAGLGPTYTNAIRLKDTYKLLKERQDLKYASLDCWNATASLLPGGATLDRLNFMDGRRLSLSGSAGQDQARQLIDFEAALRKFTKDGELLFDPSGGESMIQNLRGNTLTWSLGLVLKRSEAE